MTTCVSVDLTDIYISRLYFCSHIKRLLLSAYIIVLNILRQNSKVIMSFPIVFQAEEIYRKTFSQLLTNELTWN